MSGRPEAVARESLYCGTALSAPATMMAAQGVLTAVVAARGDQRAARALHMMGAVMASGYLAERHVRRRLSPRGWQPIETPLTAAGIGLSMAMALHGLARRTLPATGS